jgi:signal transduction histidine kinase
VDISSNHFTIQNKPVIFGSIRDITEREAYNLEMQHKSEELQRINSEKDKFFSIISHDLRAPFNGFLGLTEMMAEGLSHMTPDEIQSLAVMMKESASNLYRLLGNLLEWSQMQRGLITFAPQPLTLAIKIAETITNSVDFARKKDIDFRLNIPIGLSVIADVHMFESIIRNLCNNAVKFTPRGGRITISCKSVSEDSVEISIRDNGIGISMEMIDKLFCLDVNTNRQGTENEPSSKARL